jgi:hypothetical protein
VVRVRKGGRGLSIEEEGTTEETPVLRTSALFKKRPPPSHPF